MANFCKKCGRPLENGRCPVCDPVSNNPYAQPAPPVDFNQGSGSAFLGGLEQDFRSLQHSRDVFRLIPAAGFGVLALLLLVRFVASLSGLSYEMALVLNWVDVLASLAIGVGAVGFFKSQNWNGVALLQGTVCTLLGVSGVFNLLSLLAHQYVAFTYLFACLFLLMLGLGMTEREKVWKGIYLCGAALLTVILLLAVFVDWYFLQFLFQFYCAACAGISFVRSAANTAA